MKVHPREIRAGQLGSPCLMRLRISERGTVAHSRVHGAEQGAVTRSMVVLGRLSVVSTDGLTLIDCWQSTHTTDITFSSGPRYSAVPLFSVHWSRIKEEPLIVGGRSIQAHLQNMDRRQGVWKEWHHFKDHLRSLTTLRL